MEPAPRALPKVTLRLLPEEYAVCKFGPDAPIPAFPRAIGMASMTITDQEISIVCAASIAPAGAEVEVGWRAFYAGGPIAFGLTGVVASLVDPLAASKLPVFVISTFDGDLLLVRGESLPLALQLLIAAGHSIAP
ncbi:MAG: ACT domain-containing protein [Thermomicrobiales bacterium]